MKKWIQELFWWAILGLPVLLSLAFFLNDMIEGLYPLGIAICLTGFCWFRSKTEKGPVAQLPSNTMIRLSADEVTGQLNVSTVTKVWKHTGEYKTLRINDIVVTPEHRFKVQRNGVESWLHARDIHVGDSLITTQGIISVTSVTANEPLSQVYNLTTVPSHTYFAGGVLVHNVKNNNGDIPQLINDL
jgi:intein/homing endonuclease